MSTKKVAADIVNTALSRPENATALPHIPTVGESHSVARSGGGVANCRLDQSDDPRRAMLRRCTKCSPPETMPFIDFDRDGVRTQRGTSRLAWTRCASLTSPSGAEPRASPIVWWRGGGQRQTRQPLRALSHLVSVRGPAVEVNRT